MRSFQFRMIELQELFTDPERPLATSWACCLATARQFLRGGDHPHHVGLGRDQTALGAAGGARHPLRPREGRRLFGALEHLRWWRIASWTSIRCGLGFADLNGR